MKVYRYKASNLNLYYYSKRWKCKNISTPSDLSNIENGYITVRKDLDMTGVFGTQ